MSYKDERSPIKWMGMLRPDGEHRRTQGTRFGNAFPPFSIKVRHQRRCGFVIHVPQAQEKRARTGIEEPTHKTKQVIAAGHFTHAGLTATQGYQICFAGDRKQIEGREPSIGQFET